MNNNKSTPVREKLRSLMENFVEEHGQQSAIMVNLKAINNMLVKRNRGEELYSEISEVVKEFNSKD